MSRHQASISCGIPMLRLRGRRRPCGTSDDDDAVESETLIDPEIGRWHHVIIFRDKALNVRLSKLKKLAWKSHASNSGKAAERLEVEDREREAAAWEKQERATLLAPWMKFL